MIKYLKYKKWYKAIKESDLFDSKYYLFTYPDVRQLGVDPIKHYIKFGAAEGRNPSAEFDTAYYLETYNDVKESGVNPLAHYVLYGKEEGRKSMIKKVIKEIEKNGVEKTVKKIVDKVHSTVDNKVKKTLNSKKVDFQKMNEYASAKLYNKMNQELEKNKKINFEKPKLLDLNENEIKEVAKSLKLPKSKNPDTSIVIPVYDALKEVIECLLSIQKHIPDNIEVIIADDNSPDKRIEELLSQNKSIKYIKNKQNLGFLLNVNQAIAKAKGKYILLLNSDIQLIDNMLEILKKEFEADNSVGLVGPKIIYPNGVLQEAGCSIDKECKTQMIGVHQDPINKAYTFKRYVDYVSGACWFFKRELFEELHGFDEDFAPAYAEDLEFCARVTKNGKKILYAPEAVAVHHLSISSNALSNEYKYYQSAVNKEKFIKKHGAFYKKHSKIKPIAFYLPQYHEIKQNSYWWGKNYTEWTASASAKPQFKNHYQPHIPSDLGFYNLTHTKAFEEQAILAKRYGLHGFCFYYYNFGDFELMEKALETFMKSDADINFCLCWANENWTKRWDGNDEEILLEQKANDDKFFLQVIQNMERFVQDKRYIKVNGKPMILIYREALFEDIHSKTSLWREYWRKKYNEELYICAVDSIERAGKDGGRDPIELGFDAAVEFPVHNIQTRSTLDKDDVFKDNKFEGYLLDYPDVVEEICARPHPGYKRIPGCFPGWDNAPRRGNKSVVMRHAHPTAFQVFLEQKTNEAMLLSGDERMIFINAWNEWGEGTHLEPDLKYGHSFLNVLDKVIKEN